MVWAAYLLFICLEERVGNSSQIPILDALLDPSALNLLQKCVGNPAQNRPQRFKLVLKVRGKSRAEFTNVLKSFQTALRQVRGKSFAEFTKASKSFEEALRKVHGNTSQIPILDVLLHLNSLNYI